jgi:hypothetical protein
MDYTKLMQYSWRYLLEMQYSWRYFSEHVYDRDAGNGSQTDGGDV